MEQAEQVDQALQLKVWKDLAISKQVLMRAATDALGLEPDCNPEELKKALDATIKKGIEADANVSDAREKANVAIALMEKKVAASEKAQAIAEGAKAGTLAAKEKSEQDMAVERAAHIKEMKKIKDLVAAKDSQIKAINKALADTPENVVKKLKTLKKQKDDEATARKQVEASVTSLKKEKRQLEQRMNEAEENGKKLAEQLRNLHALCTTLHEQLGEKAEEALPELDESLLENIEKTGNGKGK